MEVREYGRCSATHHWRLRSSFTLTIPIDWFAFCFQNPLGFGVWFAIAQLVDNLQIH